jgi:septum formation protein
MWLPSGIEEVLLASTSPARRALLQALNIPFRSVPPEVDEHVPDGVTVEQAASSLALAKAQAVLSRYPRALVIGSDQLVSLDGVAFGKPGSEVDARDQLRRLSGRAHSIVTAVCVASLKRSACELDIGTLTMYKLSEAQQNAYISANEWQGCAGGYRIEARGQALFSRIDADRTAVQGLPMPLLLRMLAAAQVDVLVAPSAM